MDVDGSSSISRQLFKEMNDVIKEFILETLSDIVYKSNKDSLLLDKEGHWVEPDVRKKIGKYFDDLGLSSGDASE